MGKLDQFEKVIGYHFQSRGLLRQALTHSSFANEKHMAKRSDNERLEFLGDAVLELTTSEFLYQAYPQYSEGEMTKLRASLVCEQSLAASTEEIHLGDYIRLGKGEDLTGGRKRKSILSDTLEAVIGAIYLDGGFAGAKEFVLKYILKDIEHKQLFYDSKTILQEYVQANYEKELYYTLLEETGPDHDKQFKAAACIGKRQVGVGEGHTKKAAEQAAAYQALLTFHYNPRQKAEGKCI